MQSVTRQHLQERGVQVLQLLIGQTLSEGERLCVAAGDDCAICLRFPNRPTLEHRWNLSQFLHIDPAQRMSVSCPIAGWIRQQTMVTMKQ